ncbi:hypothetical protein ES703_73469 [subsurface metagenome]
MQQPSGKLARLYIQFFSRMAVYNLNPDAGFADPVSEFRGKVILDFFSVKVSDAWKQGSNYKFCSRVSKEHTSMSNRITGFIFYHFHLVCFFICS